MVNVTVFSLLDRISTFYSLAPFISNTNPRYRFTFTSDPHWCLEKDRNRILVMMRQFIKPDKVDLDLLITFRQKYDKIAFFHDDAGGGIPRLEVLPFVDLFYTKALFKDRSLYGKSLYGKELYSDYYHNRYGVVDPDYRERPVERNRKELEKLRLSWNIGVGDYPRHQLRQRAGVAFARVFGLPAATLFRQRERFDPERSIASNSGRYPVHARMGLIPRPSINYQRKLILEKIDGNPNFLTGPVSQTQFNRETANSKIVLSPFGWGELCLRDFEAVRSGALLLKPDMSHLETWPDIFIPGDTYEPFGWDADNLVEKAKELLSDETYRRRIVRGAAVAYRSALDTVPERFSDIMSEIIG